MDNFDRCIPFVLKWEGGYVNHPDDPGGETKYGISKRAYPDLDIKSLTLDDAKSIYRRDYWDASNCDSFDLPLAVVVFDSAVNCGVGRAKTWLSRTSNWSDYIELRLAFYKKLNKPMFLKGWQNRVAALTQFAASLEQGDH